MELWIRSQDKRRLIPIKEELYIPYSRTGEDFGIFYKNNILAHFKKEERTLEVLDEIQKLLMPISEYKNEVDNLTISYKNIDTVIYEMPEN